MIQYNIVTIIITLCILNIVDARCWCRRYVSEGDHIAAMNGGCNDYEMQAECKRAEWELVDWVNSVMAYGRTISLEAAITANNTFNVTVEAENFACLSNSIERDRPVPDCATGLNTEGGEDSYGAYVSRTWRHISPDEVEEDGKKYGFCTSEPLLKQCRLVRDGIQYYVDSVMVNLRQCSSEEFYELMSPRITNSIIPTITCKTTESHIINSGDSLQTMRYLIIVMWFLIL